MENIHSSPAAPMKLEPKQFNPLIHSDVPDTAKVDKNIPVSLYKDRFNKPYASEFFEMNKNYFLERDNDTISKLNTVEDFVLSHMKSKNLTDTKGTYNKVLNTMLKTIGSDANEKPSLILNKLNIIIQFRKLF